MPSPVILALWKSSRTIALISSVLMLGGIAGLATPGCTPVGSACYRGGCEAGDWAVVCSPYGEIPDVIVCRPVYPQNPEGICDEYVGVVSQSLGVEFCDGGATSGPSYSGWDPGASISLVNGVYEVDSSLIDEVRSDFNVVTQEDSARLEWQSTGYGKLTNISPSDMVHHLGFQNDDILISITDGITGTITLNSWADYMEAVLVYGSTSSLSISVLRGGSTVTLDYNVI